MEAWYTQQGAYHRPPDYNYGYSYEGDEGYDSYEGAYEDYGSQMNPLVAHAAASQSLTMSQLVAAQSNMEASLNAYNTSANQQWQDPSSASWGVPSMQGASTVRPNANSSAWMGTYQHPAAAPTPTVAPVPSPLPRSSRPSTGYQAPAAAAPTMPAGHTRRLEEQLMRGPSLKALALRAQHWVVILNMNYNDTADSVTQLLTTAQGLQDLLRARKLQVQTLLVGITNHSTFVDDPSYAHKIKLPLPPSLFRPLQLLVAMQAAGVPYKPISIDDLDCRTVPSNWCLPGLLFAPEEQQKQQDGSGRSGSSSSSSGGRGGAALVAAFRQLLESCPFVAPVTHFTQAGTWKLAGSLTGAAAAQQLDAGKLHGFTPMLGLQQTVPRGIWVPTSLCLPLAAVAHAHANGNRYRPLSLADMQAVNANVLLAAPPKLLAIAHPSPPTARQGPPPPRHSSASPTSFPPLPSAPRSPSPRPPQSHRTYSPPHRPLPRPVSPKPPSAAVAAAIAAAPKVVAAEADEVRTTTTKTTPSTAVHGKEVCDTGDAAVDRQPSRESTQEAPAASTAAPAGAPTPAAPTPAAPTAPTQALTPSEPSPPPAAAEGRVEQGGGGFQVSLGEADWLAEEEDASGSAAAAATGPPPPPQPQVPLPVPIPIPETEPPPPPAPAHAAANVESAQPSTPPLPIPEPLPDDGSAGVDGNAAPAAAGIAAASSLPSATPAAAAAGAAAAATASPPPSTSAATAPSHGAQLPVPEPVPEPVGVVLEQQGAVTAAGQAGQGGAPPQQAPPPGIPFLSQEHYIQLCQAAAAHFRAQSGSPLPPYQPPHPSTGTAEGGMEAPRASSQAAAPLPPMPLPIPMPVGSAPMPPTQQQQQEQLHQAQGFTGGMMYIPIPVPVPMPLPMPPPPLSADGGMPHHLQQQQDVQQPVLRADLKHEYQQHQQYHYQMPQQQQQQQQAAPPPQPSYLPPALSFLMNSARTGTSSPSSAPTGPSATAETAASPAAAAAAAAPGAAGVKAPGTPTAPAAGAAGTAGSGAAGASSTGGASKPGACTAAAAGAGAATAAGDCVTSQGPTANGGVKPEVAAPKDAWGAGGGAFLKAALSSQSSSAKSSAPHASNKNSTALAPPHTPSTTTNRTPNGALPAAAGNGNSSSSRGSTGTTQGEAGGGDGREGVGLTAEEYAAQMHRSAAAVFLGRAAGQDVGVPINWWLAELPPPSDATAAADKAASAAASKLEGEQSVHAHQGSTNKRRTTAVRLAELQAARAAAEAANPNPKLLNPPGTTILCGPFQGSQVLEMWQSGKIDGMRLVAGTQGGDGGWLPPREWDLERPAMDLLPTSLMCPVEELLARAAAGEELRPYTSRDIEQASEGLNL